MQDLVYQLKLNEYIRFYQQSANEKLFILGKFWGKCIIYNIGEVFNIYDFAKTISKTKNEPHVLMAYLSAELKTPDDL